MIIIDISFEVGNCYNYRMATSSKNWDFEIADDVKKRMIDIVKRLDLDHIQVDRVFCVRSKGSRARAYARIWGLSRIFQVTAGYQPTYVIEVLAQHYDELPDERKTKVIIHELLHIPKTFSGALRSHKARYFRVDESEVDRLYQRLKK